MTTLGMSSVYLDPKEQLLNIYKGYKYTRPGQSNIFGDNNKCYKQDMLTNAGSIDRQMEAIKDSLNKILERYYYINTTVYVTHNDIENIFLLDIDTTNKDGINIKLSDSLILEKKEI